MRSVLTWCTAVAFAVAGSQANAAWYQAKSKHFIIYANESQGELRAFAQKLERFDQAVRYVRRMPDPDLTDSERLTIFVLPDRDAVGQLIGNNWVAGFYLTRSGGSYAFVPQRSGLTMVQGDVGGTGTIHDTLTSEPVFFHEYTHHLQLQDSPLAMPAWLTEGFAEFFATAQVRDDGSVEIGRKPSYRSMALVWGHLPVDKMLSGNLKDAQDFMGDTLYAKGWLLTHYLLMDGARKGQLSRYLEGMQKGERPLDAAKAAFGDLSALSRELDQYSEQSTTLGFTIDSKLIPIGEVTTRPVDVGQAAMMRVVMRSKVEPDDDVAKDIAADATKIAAAYPSNAAVQADLAEALYNAKNYSGADAAADRALAANPKNVHALIYKGRAQMALAKANPAGVDWEKIRHWFSDANKLDTENAEPMALFYESYVEAHERLNQNAIDALLYAADLAPQDMSLRATAARLLLSLDKLDDAKAMFAPVAYNPHASPDDHEKGEKIMAAMTAGDAKTAVSLMDAWAQDQKAKKK